MKKVLSFFLILSMLVLCSCTAKKATTFNSKAVDNGYNNYLAGGKMAYKDNNLYVSFISYNALISDSTDSLGIYRFNNSGVKQVLTDAVKIDDHNFEIPYFYQTDDEIYATKYGGFAVYDATADELKESSKNADVDYFDDDIEISLKADEMK